MNSLTIKILLAGLMLVASACAPYPYYANTGFYSGGYTGEQRSYYGGAPNHYIYNHHAGRHFSHYGHDGYNGNHGWNNRSWRGHHQPDHGGNSHGGNRHNYNGGRGHHGH